MCWWAAGEEAEARPCRGQRVRLQARRTGGKPNPAHSVGSAQSFLCPSPTPPPPLQDLISKIKKNTPGADDIIISTHCQNDLGLSTANSLAGAM